MFAPATAKMVATLEYGEGENRGVYLRFGWGVLTRSLIWDQSQYLDILKLIGLEILALTTYRHK